jgi:hypothetical protein
VLTWGLLPDGVSIVTDNSQPSRLIHTLDNLYGTGPGGSDLTQRPWFGLIEQALAGWSDVSGVHYVYEPNDDRAEFPIAPGRLGIRPDIRLGGRSIDDSGGILGFNFFPNSGDMVLDTDDSSFLGNSADNSRGLRNLIGHENGHGLGLGHSCPEDKTKLMEPSITLDFDGPQHDDIQGVNRGYGDRNEFPIQNDALPVATDLGALSHGDTLALSNLSIDDDSDTDFLAFTVGERVRVSLTTAPVGTVYTVAAEESYGCPLGFFFNSKIQNDLGVDLRGPSGDVLALASSRPAGLSESITDFLLLQGSGTYFVHVFGDTDKVQLYDLELSVTGGRSPVAVCKDVASCRATVGAGRFDDGSYDPDGDPISVTAEPPGPYPLGVTVVDVIVSDGSLSDTCQATVTVNRPPEAVAGDLVVTGDTLTCTKEVQPGELDGGSTDPDGDLLTFLLDPPGPFGEGVHSVTFIAADDCGAADSTSATITVNCPVPVRLLSFEARRVGQAAVLVWEVAEARDHAGFHVYREREDGERTRLTDALLAGRSRYEYVDASPPPGEVRYWLSELSRSGDSAWHGPVTLSEMSIQGPMLFRAYPNPFARSTTWRYTVPDHRPVDLAVYDARGRRVRTLVHASPGPGQHDATWSGRTDEGRRSPAGLYLVRLVAGGEIRVQKVVYVP